MGRYNKKTGQKNESSLACLMVALPGLEPGNAAPKTVVLPLHYKAIPMSLGQLPATNAVQVECCESLLSTAETQPAFSNAVQNYCFFLICNLFIAFFLRWLFQIT